MAKLRLVFRVACTVVAVAAIAVGVLLLQPDRRAKTWNVLFLAMGRYSSSHVHYPYDSRGSSYALYYLKDDYALLRELSASQCGETLPERDYGLSQIGENRSAGGAPVWDDDTGQMVYDIIDYLNWPPERVETAPESVVLLSYDTSAWRVSNSVPYFATGAVAPSWPSSYSTYRPWVRPRHLTGLPTGDVYQLSEYGLQWDVICHPGMQLW